MHNLIIELPFKGNAKTYFKSENEIAYSPFTNFKDYQKANPDLNLKEVTQKEFQELVNAYFQTDWAEITVDEYWRMLEVLPPEKWHDIAAKLNIFFCMEALAYTFHGCYLHDAKEEKYFTATKDINSSDADLLESYLKFKSTYK